MRTRTDKDQTSCSVDRWWCPNDPPGLWYFCSVVAWNGSLEEEKKNCLCYQGVFACEDLTAITRSVFSTQSAKLAQSYLIRDQFLRRHQILLHQTCMSLIGQSKWSLNWTKSRCITVSLQSTETWHKNRLKSWGRNIFNSLVVVFLSALVYVVAFLCLLVLHAKSIKKLNNYCRPSHSPVLKVPDIVNRIWTPLLHAITSSSKTSDKWCKNLWRAVIMRFEQTEWIVSVGFKPSHEKQLLPVVQGVWRLMGRRVRDRERKRKKTASEQRTSLPGEPPGGFLST